MSSPLRTQYVVHVDSATRMRVPEALELIATAIADQLVREARETRNGTMSQPETSEHLAHVDEMLSDFTYDNNSSSPEHLAHVDEMLSLLNPVLAAHGTERS